MQVGLNVSLWCVIKRRLQEEGYFMFTSAMIVHVSCQDWKQQVEVAFDAFKGPMELWWDLYIIWMQFI